MPNVMIPDELHRQAKMAALILDVPLKDYIEGAVKARVSLTDLKTKAKKRAAVEPLGDGRKRNGGAR
jgi:hypothetical protein